MNKVFLPRTVAELWSFLEEEPEAHVYAGGTDLLVRMRAREEKPPALICMERIGELQGVREETSGLWIGACTPHRRLLDDPLIQGHLPVLAKALRILGSPQIRNMGTLGGNICTASPAGDCLPPLYILDAVVEIRSPNAVRTLPINSFIVGPEKTQLQRGEILAGVLVKRPPNFNIQFFEKVGQRKAMAIAVASLAALLRVSPSGMIEEARLAWGSVGPTVVRSGIVEAALEGEPLSSITLEKLSPIARQAVSPIDDLRASADYRRTVAGNLILRLAENIMIPPRPLPPS
ncbi:xanthine dehydrogenase FAD-binding subunit [Syntrophus gentianae]|uniref:Xanthine dehydrogenase FAD-binding subunit n=1 Tax=Syntrophus gentianae TaxID=43775 RepID=A0A1H7ZIQ4_9BACT|nr:xanthine dehydrogenase family protein subunit M [Syntrophus gentianae]SEM57418.1 xanthine dehydrogenase FAD-binding subunit [Syntrophus gentianae]